MKYVVVVQTIRQDFADGEENRLTQIYISKAEGVDILTPGILAIFDGKDREQGPSAVYASGKWESVHTFETSEEVDKFLIPYKENRPFESLIWSVVPPFFVSRSVHQETEDASET